MPDLVLLSAAQMRRIKPMFPRSRGLPRMDDRRVISGIIYVIRHGLQWKDAPVAYGPYKTLYNRFIRWSRLGVFARIFAALAAKGGTPERLMPERLMIDATHLKAHRMAASLLQKGVPAGHAVHRRRGASRAAPSARHCRSRSTSCARAGPFGGCLRRAQAGLEAVAVRGWPR